MALAWTRSTRSPATMSPPSASETGTLTLIWPSPAPAGRPASVSAMVTVRTSAGVSRAPAGTDRVLMGTKRVAARPCNEARTAMPASTASTKETKWPPLKGRGRDRRRRGGAWAGWTRNSVVLKRVLPFWLRDLRAGERFGPGPRRGLTCRHPTTAAGHDLKRAGQLGPSGYGTKARAERRRPQQEL